jgi:hypothetical protein
MSEEGIPRRSRGNNLSLHAWRTGLGGVNESVMGEDRAAFWLIAVAGLLLLLALFGALVDLNQAP